MDGLVLEIDADGRERVGDDAWEALGGIERMMRDEGIPFSPENLACARWTANLLATRREMVRAGIVLEIPDGEAWEAIL